MSDSNIAYENVWPGSSRRLLCRLLGHDWTKSCPAGMLVKRECERCDRVDELVEEGDR